MKLLIVIASFLLSVPLQAQKSLSEGLSDIASQISSSAAKREKQSIAVLPFHELGGPPTVLGSYLAEELVTNLFQHGNFTIVERQLLDKVLGELKIGQSGAIDPATAKEIGRIAAVDAIVTGSITDLETYVSLNCRLIDTTTGAVFGAGQAKIIKDENVRKVMATVMAPSQETATYRRSYQSNTAIATKDVGNLRVSLMSASRTRTGGRNGIRCVLDFMNRDAKSPIVVAMNSDELRAATGVSFGPRETPTYLRSTLIDDAGGVWKTTASLLTGVGFVRAGTSATTGFWAEQHESYSPSTIASLLEKWDRTGSNVITGKGVFDGDTFVSGSTTTIHPGATARVTLDFIATGDVGAAKSFQLASEIVTGIGSPGRRRYSLQNITLDKIVLPGGP